MSYNLNIVVALIGFTSAIIILFIVGRLGRYIYILIYIYIFIENKERKYWYLDILYAVYLCYFYRIMLD
jgi:hypothetical protein